MKMPLLCCPLCRAQRLRNAAAAISCASCGTIYPIIDGAIDFDRGRTITQLDDIDYDAFYKIDSTSSKANFAQILLDHGAIIGGRVESLLEIGTGTGGFTVGMLGQLNAERAVLSDVSTKMLSICQRRMSKEGLDRRVAIDYVTYSGKDSCFADEAFDICFGAAVLHHIMEPATCLRDVRRALRPGGKAFFIEPNRAFHSAVLHMLTDMIDREVRAGADPSDTRISAISSWVAENRYNIIHTGDTEMLWFREDKHLFDRDYVEFLRAEAGFAGVTLLATNPADLDIDSLAFFLMQMGLSDERNAEVRAKCKRLVPQYLDLMQANDRTPSYLVCFEKGLADAAVPAARPPKPAQQSSAPSAYEGYLDLKVDGPSLIVDGWLCCSATIRRLIIVIGEAATTIAVWKPRFDVYSIFVRDDRFAIYDMLFCGIDQVLPACVDADIRLTLETKSGELIDLGSHRLVDGRFQSHFLG